MPEETKVEEKTIEDPIGLITGDAPKEVLVTEKARVDAEQDAALAEILGPDPEGASPAEPKPPAPEVKDDSESDGRERDGKGRFTTKDPMGDEKVSEESTLEDAIKDKPERQANLDILDTEDYRKAVAAIQRDGTPPDLIASLDPDQIIEWGLKAAIRQDENDGYAKRLADAEKKAEETTEAQAEAQQAQPADLNWDELVQPFVVKLKEVVGDEVDVSGPLAEFGKQILGHAQASFNAHLQQQQQQIEMLTQGALRNEFTTARSILSDEWNLSDNARWQQVQDWVMDHGQNFQTMPEACLAGCHQSFAAERIADFKAKLGEQHDLRDNGQSTTETKVATPPTSQTRDEIETDLMHSIIDHGGGSDQAQKIAAQLGRGNRIGLMELTQKEP